MKGLVGFFDILGYQNFLENNSASDSALDVLKIINDIPKRAKDITESAVKSKPEYKAISEALTHIVFSDTIVFTLAYPEEADSNWIYAARIYMSVCSAVLASEMFENGLPIRGVIHEGDFITKEHCLAGKAIVEAYQLCESLDFASLVFTKYLGDKFIASQNDGSVSNDSNEIFTHLAPMKNGSEMKLLHLNWFKHLSDEHADQFEKEAENCVLNSFWAHQKDCSKSVDQKVYNTVKVMRKMLQNFRLDKSKEAVATSKK